MTYLIKDETVLEQLKFLKERTNKKSIADVLRQAVENEMQRQTATASVMERIAPVLEKARALGKPTERINWEEEKRASDELWGDE